MGRSATDAHCKKGKGLSTKAFTIAAGFLRASGSENFPDSTQGTESLFHDQVS